MSPASRAQRRPFTRSMAHNSLRRSARLRRDTDMQRSPSSSTPELDALHRSRKRKRSSLLPERRSPRKCQQIQVQVTSRSGSCNATMSGGPFTRSAKAVACSQAPSRVKELEDQLDMALQTKRELVAQFDQYKINSAQSTLKHLEEYFTCPLCFEVMACPYALIPRNCGHTFCAACILKWFFSRLHKGCGGWHEAVDCPLCRTALPHTPERTPRSIFSFPFSPNRTADTAIHGLIYTMSHELASISALASSTLSDWNEDGHSKQEWSKRERAGKTEMSSIAAQWNTLKPTDFVNIKNRLEV